MNVYIENTDKKSGNSIIYKVLRGKAVICLIFTLFLSG